MGAMQALPPLNALRAFEAAARHLSFTLAAQELRVTQAAVSHQVKGLEDRLGIKLFRRLPRGLLLTDQGQALLPELRAAFERIEQAVARIDRDGPSGSLSVSLVTTFALAWLVPRLHRFQAAWPKIEVKLVTTGRMVDFAREDVDIAIRYMAEGQHHASLRVEKLFDDVLTPLAGRAYRARLKRPEDLFDVPLIDTTGDLDWPLWLRHAGIRKPIRPALIFDSTKIAVDAAMEGSGVAIGPPFLFAEAIAAQRIFQPFELIVPNGKAWWVVTPQSRAEQTKVRAFRDWLLAEVATDASRLKAV